MLRTALLTLADQRWLREWMQGSPAASRFTSRFIAGRSLESALEVARKLQWQGIRVSLDHLGENVTSSTSAVAARDAYLKALDGIADYGLGEASVSVKLTQLGLDVSLELCRRNLSDLAGRAHQLGKGVEVDMESSTYVERTLQLVRQTHAQYRNLRVAIQAYLKRSADDIELLNSDRIPIRLCKGAYLEPAEVAFQSKAQVDGSFSHLMRRLLEAGTDPAFATHDERLIRQALDWAHARRLSPDAFEFQMLFGVRRDLQRKLAAAGFRLRLYVPYGEAWYPYFMRRMAERPANVWFLMKNLLRA